MTAAKPTPGADEKVPDDEEPPDEQHTDEDDRWSYEVDADGMIRIGNDSMGIGADIDRLPGRLETYPVRDDGLVPVTVVVGDDTVTGSNSFVATSAYITADQAEAFARDLFEQAAAAREHEAGAEDE